MDIRIERIILFVAKHFRSKLTLENLSNEIGLSKFHFQKLFKKETGQTPLHYINKIRLEHAIHFLAMYPDSSQTDIAFECGYSSPATFSRIFKKFYNLSPSLYKKNFLVNNQPPIPNINRLKLPVTYLNAKTIHVYSSNLLNKNIQKLYKKLVATIDKPTDSIGFYIDVPMHKPHNECRYYAGLYDRTDTSSTKDTYDIEAGFYTYFSVQGDFNRVSELIVSFKEEYIDNSQYQIASLIGFEKIKLPIKPSEFDYFFVTRTLFVKVKRKQQELQSS